MFGALRARPGTLRGLACVLIGACLFGVGVPFVQAWLWILGLPHGPGTATNPCGGIGGGGYCTVVVNVWLPPDPAPLLAAYAIAIPLVLAVAWTGRRAFRAPASSVRTARRLDRVAGAVLATAMIWITCLFFTGFAMDWLQIAVADWLRDVFLASLLVVPGVVTGAGGAFLWSTGRRISRERPPGAPG